MQSHISNKTCAGCNRYTTTYAHCCLACSDGHKPHTKACDKRNGVVYICTNGCLRSCDGDFKTCCQACASGSHTEKCNARH